MASNQQVEKIYEEIMEKPKRTNGDSSVDNGDSSVDNGDSSVDNGDSSVDNGDSYADNEDNSASNYMVMDKLLRTSNESRPKRRLSLTSNEDNTETTTSGESQEQQRQQQPQQQQQTQQHTTTYYRLPGFLIFNYMLLSVFCLYSSIVRFMELVKPNPGTRKYWAIVLHAVIGVSSLAILYFVYPFSKRTPGIAKRRFALCILCASLSLLSASIILYLHYDWIMLAVVIVSAILFVLLCAPRLISDFSVV